MIEHRKVTAFVPADLLTLAQANSGVSLTETLRLALEDYNRAAWYRKTLELAGKVKIDIDLNELREDREFDANGDVIR